MIAKENIIKNNYSNQISCDISDGFESNCFKNKKPFDLIVANILAGPLIDLSSEIISHLSKNGILILSGLLIDQENEVSDSYIEKGLTLINSDKINEWSILTFVKG